LGSCIYCGESAGLLHKVHKQCRDNHDAGLSRIVSLVTEAAQGKGEDILETRLTTIVTENHIASAEFRQAVVAGWQKAIDQSIDFLVASEGAIARLEELKDIFGFVEQELDRNGTYTRMVMARTLRNVLEGNLPSEPKLNSEAPYYQGKPEVLIWAFKDVKYYESESQDRYELGSDGIGVGVGKGVYHRTTGFKKRAVDEPRMHHVATGTLGITTKQLYFSSPSDNLSFPYEKVRGFGRFSDGVCVQGDTDTTGTPVFVTGNGWFTYNLISNLVSM
jgi:hypothetical protein